MEAKMFVESGSEVRGKSAAAGRRRMRFFAGTIVSAVVLVLALWSYAAAADSIGIVGDSAKSDITLGLTTQMQFQYDEIDQGEDVHPLYQSAFKWRRIRPTAKGSVDDLSFYLQLNLVPGSLELMDLYANYAFHPMAQVRVGQFKIPFTRYRIGSYKNLQFVDWSIVSRAFGAERNPGIALHNGFEKPAAWEYELGFFTGKNARKSHSVGVSDLSGEAVENPSDLVEGGKHDEFHPLTVLHLAYNFGGIVTAQDTDFEKGGPRFSVGGSAAWDANPTPYRDFALRLAPEALFKCSGFALSGVYYGSWVEKETEMSEIEPAMTGYLAQTSYLFGRVFEFGVRASQVQSAKDFRKRVQEHAAEILAAADEDLEALQEQYAKAGLTQWQTEYTAGFNVYLIGKTLKLQQDASLVRHKIVKEDPLQDLRLRTQLQLDF